MKRLLTLLLNASFLFSVASGDLSAFSGFILNEEARTLSSVREDSAPSSSRSSDDVCDFACEIETEDAPDGKNKLYTTPLNHFHIVVSHLRISTSGEDGISGSRDLRPPIA